MTMRSTDLHFTYLQMESAGASVVTTIWHYRSLIMLSRGIVWQFCGILWRPLASIYCSVPFV